MRGLFPLAAILAVTACASESEREALADEQHARLYAAVSDAVCASSRDDLEDAIGRVTDAVQNAHLLEQDGVIDGADVTVIAGDVNCLAGQAKALPSM